MLELRFPGRTYEYTQGLALDALQGDSSDARRDPAVGDLVPPSHGDDTAGGGDAARGSGTDADAGGGGGGVVSPAGSPTNANPGDVTSTATVSALAGSTVQLDSMVSGGDLLGSDDEGGVGHTTIVLPAVDAVFQSDLFLAEQVAVRLCGVASPCVTGAACRVLPAHRVVGGGRKTSSRSCARCCRRCCSRTSCSNVCRCGR